jgi:signal transduction histidine kinase
MRVTVDLLGPLAKRKEVTLAFEANDEGVAVVDAFQAQQALTNIVMNAVQASPAGGQVHVTLDRQELRHAERVDAAPADYVRISVSDSGPGVPKNQTEQIFEPFFTTKISGEGTGLGLSIARDIVREHGGWIAVSSHQGATFELYWPTRSSAERDQPSVERLSALPVC